MTTTNDALREALYRAAINCRHEIERDQIVLYYEEKQGGPNALAQLANRLFEAALAQQDTPESATIAAFAASQNPLPPDIAQVLHDNLWDLHTTGEEVAKPEQQAQAGGPRGCACRWDKDDNRVQTCERHQGWLDVVHEWAERAKTAEAETQAHREAIAADQRAALQVCVEALETFGVHNATCRINLGSSCDCGLRDAITKAQERLR